VDILRRHRGCVRGKYIKWKYINIEWKYINGKKNIYIYIYIYVYVVFFQRGLTKEMPENVHFCIQKAATLLNDWTPRRTCT